MKKHSEKGAFYASFLRPKIGLKEGAFYASFYVCKTGSFLVRFYPLFYRPAPAKIGSIWVKNETHQLKKESRFYEMSPKKREVCLHFRVFCSQIWVFCLQI